VKALANSDLKIKPTTRSFFPVLGFCLLM